MPRRSALQGGLRQRQRRLGAKTLWRGIVHRSPPEKIPKVGTTAVFGPFPNFHASNINALRDQKTRSSPKPGANRLTSASIARPPAEIPMDESEVDAIRTLLASEPRPSGWEARRRRTDEVCAVWPVAEDVALKAVDCDGVPGERSIVPGSDVAHVILFFHGGGYCSGSIRSHRRMATEPGRAAGARTLAVGYRLAPEHPFPAALDDARATWRWLRGQGVAAGNIVVGGDSAGAGLTLALADELRRAGEDSPACLWLVSPWTDLTVSGVTLATKADVDPLIHKDYPAELAAAYLPAGMDPRDPRVSPLYANLKGLPPTLIQVGSAETLLDDATRLAEAAGAADVDVTLEVWPHMIHAWPVWNARLEPGRRALMQAGAFMRRWW